MKSPLLTLSLCCIGMLISYTGGCIAADTKTPETSNLTAFKERVNESRKYYDEMVVADPENATAWCIRGMFYNNNYNRYDEALASCDRALELDPEYGLAWYLKGTILTNMKKDAEAEACFRNATKYDPTLPEGIGEPAEGSPSAARGYSIATG